MVIISKELKDLPPEERIKKLKEIESLKRNELKRKREELEELERKAKEEETERIKELQEAEQLIQDSIEDLHDEEAQAFEEMDRAVRRKEPEESLEQKVQAAPARNVDDHNIYGRQLDELKAASNFYEMTNYNVVGVVENLANKAIYEGLSFQEQETLKSFRDNLERIAGEESYQQSESFHYMNKMSQRLHDIDDQLQRGVEYKQKQDEKRRRDEQQKNVYQ